MNAITTGIYGAGLNQEHLAMLSQLDPTSIIRLGAEDGNVIGDVLDAIKLLPPGVRDALHDHGYLLHDPVAQNNLLELIEMARFIWEQLARVMVTPEIMGAEITRLTTA